MSPASRAVRSLGVLAAMLLIAGSGCARGQTGDLPAQTRASAPSSPETGEREVPKILRFEFRALDGSTVDGRTLAGKDLALWSWAPW